MTTTHRALACSGLIFAYSTATACFIMTGFDLERFVAAQCDSYERAVAEIRKGQKQTHWIWYIFPQLAGLGRSRMAQYYAIGLLAEAQAYLAHPLLGPRYIACVEAMQDLPLSDPEAVFGSLDARKVHSSLTLFAKADPTQRLFQAAIARWFKGVLDPRTLELLQSAAPSPAP